MKKVCVFLCVLVLLFPGFEKIAYAIPDFSNSSVDIVVEPLLHYKGVPIQWNFQGYITSDDIFWPYYSVFLGKIRKDDGSGDFELNSGGRILPNPQILRAATGCIPTSMGAIMYAQAYPNANVPELLGKSIDVETPLNVYEVYWGNILGLKIPVLDVLERNLKGGTVSRHFYNWELMLPHPDTHWHIVCRVGQY